MADTLKVKFNDDGSVSINATGMKGTEKEILAQLNSLAAAVGGSLKVEKHEPGLHHHHDGKAHIHN